MSNKHELEGKFEPKTFEEEIYNNWEKKGYFKPSEDKSKKPYTIMARIIAKTKAIKLLLNKI